MIMIKHNKISKREAASKRSIECAAYRQGEKMTKKALNTTDFVWSPSQITVEIKISDPITQCSW